MSSGGTNPFSETPPAMLRGAALILRLMVIGVVIAAIAGSFLYAGGWFTPHAL